jgi:carbamoyltransferase
MVHNSVARMQHALSLQDQLAAALSVTRSDLRAEYHYVEHHMAHCASAFLVSGYERAAVLSVDGFGDYLSAMLVSGEGNRMRQLGSVTFPHSIGALYTALTQYCGFTRYGDEWKLMGLAPYGQPAYLDEMRRMIRPTRRGYELNLAYFVHHVKPVYQNWQGQVPTQDIMYSDTLVRRLGPAREPGSELSDHYRDVARSVQAVVEQILFHMLEVLYRATGNQRLCMAGGVALNSVFNGKVLPNTPFEDIFIQAAAGDGGLALGAAFYVHNVLLGRPRTYVMEHAYLGPDHSDEDITSALAEAGLPARRRSEAQLVDETADLVAAGKIVGWYQGKMEFGPRALGNRSIVADPRRPDMKDILNERIKRRETFRPFAPSVLLEATEQYFEQSYPDPFMLRVYPIRPDKRGLIPAVTHVDGTGRLQTVDRRTNPRYWALIKAFERKTGIPLVLNTSFNENEPIVNTPREAIECFLRTRMDALILGDYLLSRVEPGVSEKVAETEPTAV